MSSLRMRKQGWLRLWLLATVTWLVFVALDNSYSISYFLGYYYKSYELNKSIPGLINHEISSAKSKEKCWQAAKIACMKSKNGENIYDAIIRSNFNIDDCVQSPKFASAYSNLSLKEDIKNLSDQNPDSCRYIMNVEQPNMNFSFIIFALLIPIIPWVIYRIGQWIFNGFRGGN